jgi:hypothetical protein
MSMTPFSAPLSAGSNIKDRGGFRIRREVVKRTKHEYRRTSAKCAYQGER